MQKEINLLPMVTVATPLPPHPHTFKFFIQFQKKKAFLKFFLMDVAVVADGKSKRKYFSAQ